MQNKKTLLILIVAFVILLAGASVLYHFLSKNVDTNPLMIQNTSSDTTDPETNTSSDTTDPETNTSDPSDSETNTSDSTDPQTNTSDSTDPQTNTAPDFTVTDINGRQVRLSDFIGKPVILNFWASWCGPCKSEMPDFNAAYSEYKEEIHFLMVNLTDGSRETVEIASSYITEQGYSFPVYYDTLSEASVTYGVYSVPTTYFIDAAGNLIAHAQGAINRETLQTGIDMIHSN